MYLKCECWWELWLRRKLYMWFIVLCCHQWLRRKLYVVYCFVLPSVGRFYLYLDNRHSMYIYRHLIPWYPSMCVTPPHVVRGCNSGGASRRSELNVVPRNFAFSVVEIFECICTAYPGHLLLVTAFWNCAFLQTLPPFRGHSSPGGVCFHLLQCLLLHRLCVACNQCF